MNNTKVNEIFDISKFDLLKSHLLLSLQMDNKGT